MEEYFFSIGNIIISLSGTTGNILSLFCMWKLGRLHMEANNADKLLMALNMIDLYQCTITVPYQAFTYLKSKSGSGFLYSYLTAVGFWFSSFMVVLIALNRYIKISKPSRYHITMNKRRVTITICVSLLFSIIAPLTFLMSVIVMGAINAIILICTILLLPSFYLLIKRKMTRSRGRVKATITSVNAVESKVNRNVLILIVVYFLCTFDLFIMTCTFIFNQYDYNHMRVGVMLMSANSALNPVIYVLRDTSFRRKLRALFFRKKKEHPTIKNVQMANLQQQKFKSDGNIQFIEVQDNKRIQPYKTLQIHQNLANLQRTVVNLNEENRENKKKTDVRRYTNTDKSTRT